MAYKLRRKAVKKLLDVVRDLGSWSSRLVIAQQLGRERLNTHDIAILNMLVRHGLVEVRKTKISSGMSVNYEYRCVELKEQDTLPPAAIE